MKSEPHSERQEQENSLLSAIKVRRPELEKLLADCSGHWEYEDRIYRFYHQSFKVFSLQTTTEEIVATLRSLLPGRELNPWVLQIIGEGTGKKLELSMNECWREETRPIVEAFFHARFMLEMAVRYATLDEPPPMLPSGWAALLYLYDLR